MVNIEKSDKNFTQFQDEEDEASAKFVFVVKAGALLVDPEGQDDLEPHEEDRGVEDTGHEVEDIVVKDVVGEEEKVENVVALHDDQGDDGEFSGFLRGLDHDLLQTEQDDEINGRADGFHQHGIKSLV